MNHIYVFWFLATEGSDLFKYRRTKGRNLLGIANFSTIVRSQHDYFFIPTTQKQIIV